MTGIQVLLVLMKNKDDDAYEVAREVFRAVRKLGLWS